MSLFPKRFADGARLELNGVVVRLAVNRRARRISLRIDAKTGEARVTAPSLSRLADAVDFAQSRRDWIATQLAARPTPKTWRAGDLITVFGETCRLDPDGRRPRFVSGDHNGSTRLTGCGRGDVDIGLVTRAIRHEALAVFARRVNHYCTALGEPTPTLSLSDAHTRWGSCAPARAGRPPSIRLSWRLALAPFLVADYVVAHECAHLLEANHGPRFWRHVHGLVGEHRPHRDWLRAHGGGLHAFGR